MKQARNEALRQLYRVLYSKQCFIAEAQSGLVNLPSTHSFLRRIHVRSASFSGFLSPTRYGYSWAMLLARVSFFFASIFSIQVELIMHKW